PAWSVVPHRSQTAVPMHAVFMKASLQGSGIIAAAVEGAARKTLAQEEPSWDVKRPVDDPLIT
ncbi:hypothetical protein, partial [Paracoccus sp. SY]|uniref:hypothetical protein n=1 Tax=Paracoccus sp. SY TaxID=1330255 RepID=UPI0019616681